MILESALENVNARLINIKRIVFFEALQHTLTRFENQSTQVLTRLF